VIRNHILRFWSSFPGLNHVPKKVYLHRPDGLDITVITEYEITFPNGLHVKGESVAVLEFVERDERLFLSSNRLILVRGAHLGVLMSQLLGLISFDFILSLPWTYICLLTHSGRIRIL
jgi:hypothetical protein